MQIQMPLWPAGAPGVTPGGTQEHDVTTPADGLTAGRPVIRLTDVTDPTLTVYRPARETGTTVLVFPGGGYEILAMDLEGTEVCAWLTTIGVTAVLVKYRVPDPPPRTRSLADAQRAMGLVRSHAVEWKTGTGPLGVLGFSAGGHLAASLSVRFRNRVYAPLDDADRLSCRPDFTVLIYPAYLTEGRGSIALDTALRPGGDAPPAFMVQTEDDQFDVNNSLAYNRGLEQAGVRAEMHLYAAGGHGYGLRPSPLPASSWPRRLEDWMRSMQFLPGA
jgi:acetyl esterase/lipase